MDSLHGALLVAGTTSDAGKSALVAGLCSMARLRPSVRNPTPAETEVEVPVLKQTR